MTKLLSFFESRRIVLEFFILLKTSPCMNAFTIWLNQVSITLENSWNQDCRLKIALCMLASQQSMTLSFREMHRMDLTCFLFYFSRYIFYYAYSIERKSNARNADDCCETVERTWIKNEEEKKNMNELTGFGFKWESIDIVWMRASCLNLYVSVFWLHSRFCSSFFFVLVLLHKNIRKYRFFIAFFIILFVCVCVSSWNGRIESNSATDLHYVLEFLSRAFWIDEFRCGVHASARFSCILYTLYNRISYLPRSIWREEGPSKTAYVFNEAWVWATKFWYFYCW